jgi:divalent metal cation (Fe/Co/Zn/Cd) transporter
VQTTLTIAALSKDAVISIWLDGIGAAFVACTMVSIGLKMMQECVPDLLDHAIPESMKKQIDDVLEAAGVNPEEVAQLRTRRSGSLAQVELTLAPANCLFLADFKQRVGRIQQTIESRIQEADVAIVVDDGGG